MSRHRATITRPALLKRYADRLGLPLDYVTESFKATPLPKLRDIVESMEKTPRGQHAAFRRGDQEWHAGLTR